MNIGLPLLLFLGGRQLSICLNISGGGEITTLYASTKHCWKVPFLKSSVSLKSKADSLLFLFTQLRRLLCHWKWNSPLCIEHAFNDSKIIISDSQSFINSLWDEFLSGHHPSLKISISLPLISSYSLSAINLNVISSTSKPCVHFLPREWGKADGKTHSLSLNSLAF